MFTKPFYLLLTEPLELPVQLLAFPVQICPPFCNSYVYCVLVETSILPTCLLVTLFFKAWLK